MAAFQRRRAPDPHQRYFDQPDGGGTTDWGEEIGLSQVPRLDLEQPAIPPVGRGENSPG